MEGAFGPDYFYAPSEEESGGILNYPCPSGYRYMVCPAISSYSLQFWSNSFNILYDVYIHNGDVHVHRIFIFIEYSQNDRY